MNLRLLFVFPAYHKFSAQMDGWTRVRRYWNVERSAAFSIN